jgi:hypothetical protein
VKRAHARGERIGRYVVVDTIGVGAMGTVHAAYDPELARTVALKVVRPQAAVRVGAHELRMRLLREAQAMARVVHPNVVPIFDVGQHGDRLYFAMELIDGSNLRHWLAHERPSTRALLDVLVPAGRGLAAAHREGLVHRDFKPENVLVGRDGRVCVTDFGLARPTAARDGVGTLAGVLGVTLSREGDRIGTPAYMAPELDRGAPADPRSDLYAFCVVLCEGLLGQRPDDASNVPRTLPRRLRQILRRGLDPDPERRFASMDALLAELEPLHRRRRVLLRSACAGALVLGAVGFGLATVVQQAQADACASMGREPDDAWSSSERARLRARFEHVPRATLSHVLGTIDDRVASWRAADLEVCEATWVRGEQSPELLDARASCLRIAWSRVRHTVRLLGEADIETARALVDSLPPPDRCRTTEAMPPLDDDARQVWTDAHAAVVDADVLRVAGRREEAMALLQPILAPVRALGRTSLLAEMLLVLARLEHDTGNARAAGLALDEALRIARATHLPALEAEAWITLAGAPGAAPEERQFCTRMALAAIAVAGGDPWLEARATSPCARRDCGQVAQNAVQLAQTPNDSSAAP